MKLKKKEIHNSIGKKVQGEKPIDESIYPVLDTDLARDNVENDLPAADLEDI